MSCYSESDLVSTDDFGAAEFFIRRTFRDVFESHSGYHNVMSVLNFEKKYLDKAKDPLSFVFFILREKRYAAIDIYAKIERLPNVTKYLIDRNDCVSTVVRDFFLNHIGVVWTPKIESFLREINKQCIRATPTNHFSSRVHRVKNPVFKLLDLSLPFEDNAYQKVFRIRTQILKYLELNGIEEIPRNQRENFRILLSTIRLFFLLKELEVDLDDLLSNITTRHYQSHWLMRGYFFQRVGAYEIARIKHRKVEEQIKSLNELNLSSSIGMGLSKVSCYLRPFYFYYPNLYKYIIQEVVTLFSYDLEIEKNTIFSYYKTLALNEYACRCRLGIVNTRSCITHLKRYVARNYKIGRYDFEA